MAEAAESRSTAWQEIGSVDELKKRKCRRLYAESRKDVALFYVEGKFYATSAICPHAKGPLDQGDIEDMGGSYQVVCPTHAYSYNLVTGQCIGSTLKLDIYPTEERDGQLYVQYPEPLSLKMLVSGQSSLFK